MAHPAPGNIGTDAWANGVDAAVAAVPGKLDTATANATYLTPSQASAKYVSYVLPPNNEQWSDTANILAAVNALPTGSLGGGRVIYQPGQYQLNSPLPDVSSVTYEGAGNTATTLLLVNGSLLAPTTGLHDIVFKSLKLLQSNGGHMFSFTGSGGLALSHFIDCWFQTVVAGASLFYMSSAGDFLGNTFTRCQFNRPASSTVSGINLTNTDGGLNCNTWTDCRFSSALCTTGGPFVRLESPNDYCHDNAFRDITGEQNPGGLIHVYSPDGLVLDNVHDWDDAATAFIDHMVKVDLTTGGAPKNIYARNVSARYATNMGIYKDFISSEGSTPDGVWATYTPTLTGTGTTQGNATCSGAYQKTGKTVNFWAKIVLGTTTTMGTDVEISLPSAKVSDATYTSMSGAATRTGWAEYLLAACTGLDQAHMGMSKYDMSAAVSATVPFTWAATDIIELHGTYQAA